MNRWWQDLVGPADPLSAVAPQLDPRRALVLEKSQYDAFYETDLTEILAERAVRQVVICGVMANLCCETTARSAFIRGLEVFFVVDATAAYNEQFHAATLRNLAFGFAELANVDEIITALESDSAP